MAASDEKAQKWLNTATIKDFNERIALLWTNGRPFYETILNVVGKHGEVEGSFEVHKLILAMGSRKFATELFSKSPEEIPMDIAFNIAVENVSTAIMELVLEFLYTDDIERNVDLVEIGGLMYFAKEYDIPRLIKYCTDKFEREIGQRCEKVLELFRELISLSTEQYKWPKDYYKEIVKLCLSYILRNGDVILRASNFRNKFSIENLESFIGSDYFCIPSEVLVFRGLLKWARAQCRKNGLDAHNIENVKNMLRKPDEDKESLGLLKYVRFPVFTEDEFFHELNQSSDRIIPKKFEELVHRYHVLEEPTSIFSEKRRPVEVDVENKDFQKHIDQLICKLPAFATTLEVIPADNSYLPSLPDDDDLPSSSQSGNTNQINIASIKQEVDTETQSYIPSIPDPISIGSSTTQNSQWSSCSSTPVRPLTRKRTTLKRTGNEAELTETKKISPIKIMKIKNEVEEKTEDPIRDLKLPAGKSTSTDDQNDEAVLKNQVIHTNKVTYSGIVKECSKNSNISVFVANHLEIVDSKAKSKFQSVCMPQLRSFSVDATLDKETEKNLVKYLAGINLEDFIFFYHDDNDPKNRLAQIWGKKINTTFKLSEVTVLHANAELSDSDQLPQLTLNYTKKSSFFSLNGQGALNGINVLNLGNCKLNEKGWLQNEISEKLVELRLFRVKDLDLHAILRQCKSLKVLCIWAVENQVPTICLNDIASQNLYKLCVTGYMIKFNPDSNNSVFPKCEKLSLINYSCDPVFTEMMPKTFPKLRKLSVFNETYPPGIDFLLKVTSGGSLEEVFLWNFEEKCMNVEKVSKLKSFIKNFDLIFKKGSSVVECSFRLKRRTPDLWEGKNVKMKDLPNYTFVSFGLDCFYSFEAFKKLIWINFV